MNRMHLSCRMACAALGLLSVVIATGSAGAAVGRTDASFGVSQNGAAIYTISLQATEGIRGMTPELAISYAGPGSRSIFGVGFVLSGISYITPCRKTIAQDLNAAPVTLTSADRYCLDGARLRLVNSGDTYGGNNVQYRTELDRMVRVTSKNSTSAIPGWFQVEMPNGLTYQYGNSTDSKLMSSALTGASPQFWAVNKISDDFGNSIVFAYDSDAATQRFRPSAISYTERSGTGHYKVSFVYQTTTQLAPLYAFTPSLSGGAAHKEDKLLDRIELKHDNVVYRAYKFSYENGAGYNSRLTSVQECAYAPSEDCLPPTQLGWQSATAGHNALASTGRVVAGDIFPLDINGDGIEDLVFAKSGTWRYMLGGASGFGTIQNTGVTATNPSKAMPLEWNGDGYWDLMIDWSDGYWRVLRGSKDGIITSPVAAGPGGIASFTPNTSWTVADVDADGRDDLLSVPLNAALSIYVNYNGTNGFGGSSLAFSDPFVHTKASNPWIPNNGSNSSIRRPDFNGDGRTDLLIFGCIWETEPPGWCITDRWFQVLSQGTTFTNEGPLPSAAFNIQVRYGDFNGDGLTDAIYPATTGVWNLGFGQGSGGFAIVAGPSSAAHATYQTLTGDYDGDGFDDFYVTKNSPFQWEIFSGTGTGLATTPITPSPAISGSGLGWMLIDQNGDGLPDLGRYDSGSLVWSLGAHQGLPGEHLLSATDGLANEVSFAYLPMTSASVYTKGEGAAYPERDFRGSYPLVSTLQVSPAGGTSYTVDYAYLNARIHSQGRSFLGMGERQATDNRNGIYTDETFRQDFPYIGAAATRIVKQSAAGNPIQNVAFTYLHHVLASFAGGERFLPYRSGATTKIYEVDGLKNGNLITEILEGTVVNSFGNTTKYTVLVDDEDAGSPEYGSRWSTVIDTTFSEDQTNWCIAIPTSRSETRTLPDATAATRSASWQVDGADCHVTQETLEPGGGSLLSLVTDVGYDGCGNVNSLTSQPAGTTGLARTTSINYGSRCQLPETLTNPENHAVGIAYDWRLAMPATQTDPNGLVTNLDFDGFGRLTRQDRPDGTAVQIDRSSCTAGNNWCGKDSSARLRVTRTERNTSNVILRSDEIFLDGLGRTRWTHKDSLESGPAIIETLYDALNRPTERTQPYFAGNPVYSTSVEYDLLGRVTSIDAPINEAQTTGRVTGFAYEGRELKVTDPEAFVTTRRLDPLGQLRALTDPGTGGITEYSYHPFGELASIEDPNGNVTSWTVNDRGFMTSTSDPDSGVWNYEVNAFGETAKIQDAKTAVGNWTAQFTFDKLSRPLTRDEAEGTTTFVWGKASDNSATNKYIGRLKSVSSPGGYAELYRYDALARLDQLRTTIDGVNHYFNQTYDAATGLLWKLKYPTSTGTYRHEIAFAYDNNRLRSVSQVAGTQTVYWTGNSTDAFGHYQDEAFGNGIIEITDFDQASGLMTGREAGVSGGTGKINSLVDWHSDLRGNVSSRQDLKLTPASAESFVNDSLSRLDDSTLNGSPNLDVNYDAIGNITSKDGQTYYYTRNASGCTYNFPHLQPRAVHKIGSTKYCYDANGNMTKRAGSSISYASYNLPTLINSGSNSSALYYGAFRNRYKQVAVSSGASETTIYVADGLFEKVTRPGGVIEYRHYLPGGQGIAALHTRRSAGGNSTYYWHADHLGSPEAFTDSGATVLVRPSFGAFGERRDGSDWNGPPSAADLTAIGNITRRGFTGHEHLDSVGLIHMNGRVYDPAMGRFLSADPILGVGISQDVNGYNYAWNSPLNVTDPSGLCEPGQPFCNWIDGPGDIKSKLLSELDAHGWVSFEPPNPNEPAAAGALIPGTGANWIASMRWDGQQHGVQPVRYGVLDSTARQGSTVGGARGGYVDAIQATLDIASLGLDASVAGAPFSFIPDILNAGISLGRGDFTGAGLSTVAAIPFIGATGNVARLGRQAASSAAQAARLSRQLASQEIAGGHAFIKHVIQRGEFPGIRTRAEFANMIENVMEKASHVRNLSGGRTAFWRDGVVVIRNPGAVDGGTAFVPNGNGFDYFMNVLQ